MSHLDAFMAVAVRLLRENNTQKISPEAFFERASNNVAIEKKKKDVVNGKQVLKQLQLKT